MKLVKIKRNDDKVVFVYNTEEGKITKEMTIESFSNVQTLNAGLNTIGGRAYSMLYGTPPANAIVQTNELMIKWDGDAVKKVKIGGTLTVAIGPADKSVNIDGTWKNKAFIDAAIQSDTQDGADILSQVVALVTSLGNP